MGPAILSGLPPTGVYPGQTAIIVMTSPMNIKPPIKTINIIIGGPENEMLKTDSQCF